MKAKDIMTPNVATVAPDASVVEIAKLMLDRHISAVPVVDGHGHLIGIVSEGDLMRRPELGTERKRSWWLQALVGSDYKAHEFVQLHGRKARDIMTREVVTVHEDAPIQEIVTLLEERRIKRVPVVHERRPVGIVSRANLLRAFASRDAAAPAELPSRDRDTKHRLEAALAKEPWWNKRACSVNVVGGIAHLWGTTESAEEREAIRVMAENTSGVSGIKNHINVMKPMALLPG
jgi:CBS domain-containing protein